MALILVRSKMQVVTSPGYQLSYYFVAMDNLGQSFPSDKYTTTLKWL